MKNIMNAEKENNALEKQIDMLETKTYGLGENHMLFLGETPPGSR